MAASLPYEDWLLERLKDPSEAAAYLEAVIEEGNQDALMLALRQVAMAQGGVASLARRAKVTREAAYRMLSATGNPELRSLNAILGAAGLRLSVKPITREAKVAQGRAPYRFFAAIERMRVEGHDPANDEPFEVPRMGPPRPVVLGKRSAARGGKVRKTGNGRRAQKT